MAKPDCELVEDRKQRQRESHKRFRERNRERLRAEARDRYADKPATIRAQVLERKRREYARRKALHPDLVKQKRHAQYLRRGREYSERWRRAHPDAVAASFKKWRDTNPQKLRDSQLRYQYGVGVDEYEAMHAKQDGCCAICKRPERRLVDSKSQRVRRLAVDHCHATRRVRGLLCAACNTALGLFDHNSSTLDAARNYLHEMRGTLVAQPHLVTQSHAGTRARDAVEDHPRAEQLITHESSMCCIPPDESDAQKV